MANTQANEKYYRQNGDVVQGADITSVRRQQLKDAIRNNRLGTYNAHGRYTLAPRITNEILGITKYIYKTHYNEVLRESKETLEFKATASIPVFGQMEFRIVFKEKIAKLYLIENVYREFNGYQEIYGEQITEINCEDDRDDVVDYVLSLLNVSVIDEADFGKIPDEDPEKVKAIIFDKLYLSIVAKNYLKESADDERDTFEDMVRILKEDGGEYGKRVLKNFIDRIEKRPDIMQLKDEDGYNEALNDALVGALEVSTTEEDMRDPHNKKIYDDIYKRRYKKTEEDLRKAQEDVKDKDFKKVADGVLGRDVSDKLFGDQEEIASLIRGKQEETKLDEQDNSLLDELLRNPIINTTLGRVLRPDMTRGQEDPAKEDATQTAADQDAARRMEEELARAAGQDAQTTAGGQGQESNEKAKAKTDESVRAGIAATRARNEAADNAQASYDWGKGQAYRSSSNKSKSEEDKVRNDSSQAYGNRVNTNRVNVDDNKGQDEPGEERTEKSNLKMRQKGQAHANGEMQQTSYEEIREQSNVGEAKSTKNVGQNQDGQRVETGAAQEPREERIVDESLEDDVYNDVEDNVETPEDQAAREAAERAKYEEILRKAAEETAARAAKMEADKAAAEAAAKEAATEKSTEENFTINQGPEMTQ